ACLRKTSQTIGTTLQVMHTTLAADPNVSTTPEAEPVPDPAHETPVEFAQELLAKVTPSTDVTVESPQYVAGRPAYQLSLAPHASDSTVQQIAIAVDAAAGLPLEVKIVARSTGNAALTFGFSNISFDQPAASTFDFKPPPGSTLREAADLATFINPPHRHPRERTGTSGGAVAAPSTPESATDVSDRVTTVGSDWGTIAILSPGTVPAELSALLSSSPQVTAGPLIGRMLSTPLVSVLLLDDGRAAIAALTPAALTDAVAKLG
ncbi:MAG: hypothetical protein ABI658_29900, partial [Acidimicrobiales bacterium]